MIIVGKKTHSSSRLRTFSGSGLLTFLIGPAQSTSEADGNVIRVLLEIFGH